MAEFFKLFFVFFPITNTFFQRQSSAQVDAHVGNYCIDLYQQDWYWGSSDLQNSIHFWSNFSSRGKQKGLFLAAHRKLQHQLTQHVSNQVTSAAKKYVSLELAHIFLLCLCLQQSFQFFGRKPVKLINSFTAELQKQISLLKIVTGYLISIECFILLFFTGNESGFRTK